METVFRTVEFMLIDLSTLLPDEGPSGKITQMQYRYFELSVYVVIDTAKMLCMHDVAIKAIKSQKRYLLRLEPWTHNGYSLFCNCRNIPVHIGTGKNMVLCFRSISHFTAFKFKTLRP